MCNDLVKEKQKEVSTIRPPYQDETDTWPKALELLESVFKNSGIRVNVFRDIYIGVLTGFLKNQED